MGASPTKTSKRSFQLSSQSSAGISCANTMSKPAARTAFAQVFAGSTYFEPPGPPQPKLQVIARMPLAVAGDEVVDEAPEAGDDLGVEALGRREHLVRASRLLAGRVQRGVDRAAFDR